MKLLDYIRRYKWDLGITVNSEGHSFISPDWNFHVIKAPRNRWFADPFILDVTNDSIIVLVEEVEHRTNKGRLAKLTIDKKTYQIRNVKIVLDLPTHLSFPAIYRDVDKVYIYPENSQSGCSTIYEYNQIDDSLVVHDCLLHEPLTDAIMLEFNDKHYLFSTKTPIQNDNILYVYQSSEKLSSYQEIQKITLSGKTARSAGDFFEYKGKLIRPSQNCDNGYGEGLVFYELTWELNNGFALKEVARHSPLKGYIGMHTYNTYKGYTIIDLHARRFPRLHKIMQNLKHLF